MKPKNLFVALLLMIVALGTNMTTAAGSMAANVKNTPVNHKSLMSKKPKKGKIVKETYNESLGFKDLELSNGVHVLIKSINGNQNGILMSARRCGGSSLYGEKDWANCEMFTPAIKASGLGGMNNAELKKVLDGKDIEIFQSMEIDNDHLSISAKAIDPETLFQLTYLQFTDITKDEDSFKTMLNETGTWYQEQEREMALDATSVFLDTIMSVMYDHNWRFKSLKAADLARVNYDRILEMAKERTANAANYTFVLVGAFNEATIRPLIERYIASLPANKDVKSNWVNVATYPQKETICHFTTKMETPQTQINIRWINTQLPDNYENYIKASFLSDILKKNQREMLPEQFGATRPVGGNPGSRTEGDVTFTEVHCFVTVKPEYADETVRILKEEMLKACGHIDAESLEVLKKGELERLERRKNSTEETNLWSSIYSEASAISNYAWRGIEHEPDYDQIVRSQTPETISAFARQLLSTGNMIEIVMSPAE